MISIDTEVEFPTVIATVIGRMAKISAAAVVETDPGIEATNWIKCQTLSWELFVVNTATIDPVKGRITSMSIVAALETPTEIVSARDRMVKMSMVEETECVGWIIAANPTARRSAGWEVE